MSFFPSGSYDAWKTQTRPEDREEEEPEPEEDDGPDLDDYDSFPSDPDEDPLGGLTEQERAVLEDFYLLQAHDEELWAREEMWDREIRHFLGL